MILGASAIRAALSSGAIVCDPLPATIEGAHIDVTLGVYGWVFTGAAHDDEVMLRGADPSEWFTSVRRLDDSLIVPARGFILAHTVEVIGTAPGSGLVPMLHTRSTLARWGLSVCTANAGQGDEGYTSRWTLEIVNPHPVAVAIPVGARVGSISFHRTEGDAPAYEGRYNAQPDTWTPASMLPRRGNW